MMYSYVLSIVIMHRRERGEISVTTILSDKDDRFMKVVLVVTMSRVHMSMAIMLERWEYR